MENAGIKLIALIASKLVNILPSTLPNPDTFITQRCQELPRRTPTQRIYVFFMSL